MKYNEMIFQDISGLNSISQLIDNRLVPYLALIQIEDCIDTYILNDIEVDTLNQLAYYLYIAYDIRLFNQDNVKLINLYDNKSIDINTCICIMNAYINQLVYDSSTYEAIDSDSSLYY